MAQDSPEATVRSYYDRIDADDYESLFELFATDVVYHRPGQEPIRGLDELEQFYLEDRPLSGGHHELESVVVDAETVAVRGRYVGRQNGESVELGFADFHRLSDGRIVERHTFTDRDTV